MMSYDIVIIGGGIHGAACADNLTETGYNVLILEQYQQPGMATSSKSSKLIHGGLRYLESFDFKLVHECLQQRKHLLSAYPDLVKLVPFHIPVYKDSHRKSWLIRIGLIIYSLFSLKYFKIIKKNKWAHLDNLKTENLKTVFQYFDAQTNDTLLTQKVMQHAQKKGASLITDAHFISADCSDSLCKIKYSKNNTTYDISAKKVINAAGPWVNHVLQQITPEQSQVNIDLVAGTHIVVNGKLKQGMYYLESPQDKRAVFAMPWKSATNGDQILIGTTESIFTGLPENIAPRTEDINYLLGVYNHYFSKQLNLSDVIESFAGLRVLPAASGSAFHRSRDTIIHYDPINNPKVFSIYGGKLTAHRVTAQQCTKILTRYFK